MTIPPESRDGQLGERLELSADSVLAWAVEGLQDYLADGLKEPKAVEGATGEYLKASDAVARFIEEQCVTGPGFTATLAQLYEAWDKWSQIDDTQRLGKFQFRDQMEAHGFIPDGSKARRFNGIGVLADD